MKVYRLINFDDGPEDSSKEKKGDSKFKRFVKTTSTNLIGDPLRVAAVSIKNRDRIAQINRLLAQAEALENPTQLDKVIDAITRIVDGMKGTDISGSVERATNAKIDALKKKAESLKTDPIRELERHKQIKVDARNTRDTTTMQGVNVRREEIEDAKNRAKADAETARVKDWRSSGGSGSFYTTTQDVLKAMYENSDERNKDTVKNKLGKKTKKKDDSTTSEAGKNHLSDSDSYCYSKSNESDEEVANDKMPIIGPKAVKGILGLSAVGLMSYFGIKKYRQLQMEAAENGMSIKEYLIAKFGGGITNKVLNAPTKLVESARPSNPLLEAY